MTLFVHPAKEDITLSGVLGALAEPMRLKIMKGMLAEHGCVSCTDAAPCPDMAKSTLSNHFRILREAGLIRTTKKGVTNRNLVRLEDINDRFPGLLKLLFKLAE
jgi:DNA-binding transcriptional ArsR family regulator